MAVGSGDKPGRGLTELLGKALTDKEMRSKLFADPDGTARAFNLSGQDTEALKKLDSAKFEHAATQLASRQEWTVKVVVSKKF
jgi:hypothetical protein